MNKLLIRAWDLESCLELSLSGENPEGMIFYLKANWQEGGSHAGVLGKNFPNKN